MFTIWDSYRDFAQPSPIITEDFAQDAQISAENKRRRARGLRPMTNREIGEFLNAKVSVPKMVPVLLMYNAQPITIGANGLTDLAYWPSYDWPAHSRNPWYWKEQKALISVEETDSVTRDSSLAGTIWAWVYQNFISHMRTQSSHFDSIEHVSRNPVRTHRHLKRSDRGLPDLVTYSSNATATVRKKDSKGEIPNPETFLICWSYIRLFPADFEKQDPDVVGVTRANSWIAEKWLELDMQEMFYSPQVEPAL